jgi:uncharacterized 2Fe-2S/4Fe-4S cluster protein (DUF4445 family)
MSRISSDSVTITIEPEGRKIETKIKSNLLRVLQKSGVNVRSDCGGKGVCGKCKIKIFNQKSVNPLSKIEKRLLSNEEIKDGSRLACQIKCTEKLYVNIPEENISRKRRVQINGIERTIPLNPTIKKLHSVIPKPDLNDLRSDIQRTLDLLEKKYGISELEIDYDILIAIPELLRRSDWDVNIVIWNEKKIISIEPTNGEDAIYGISVDIGTSKIVLYLLDLSNGETIGTSFIENPQMIFGEDIISRISYSADSNKNLDELRSVVINGINKMIIEVCEKNGINTNNVYEATIVGNTAMHHIFLGIQPKNVALAPYVPVIRRSLNLQSSQSRLRLNPNGVVHTFPVIAGFVGADNVAALLSTALHKSDDVSLLLDIGTNTEVDLGNKTDILCCSCASGPAFEGAHIKHGMKAVEGAIEKVQIDHPNDNLNYTTIGDYKPVGICGSGVIDILAEMLRYGLIDKAGRMINDTSTQRLRKVNGIIEYVLAWENETDTDQDIVISQKDVRELQLAKAAIFTGCSILMKRKNIDVGDIKKVYIAGAFGNYINPRNAKTIGLFPNVEIDRIEFVGNAAGSGAKMALTSKEAREEAEEISKNVRYLELGAEPNFNKEFASALFFPEIKLNC